MDRSLCQKCGINFAVKDGNFCRIHAGKNPKIEKTFERGLIEYYRKLLKRRER